MVVSSPVEFAAAVRAYAVDRVELAPAAVAAARAALTGAGVLLLGEPHGVRETPAVVHALACALATRALALEWAHEELDAPVQRLLETGELDADALWSLPPTAELFSGDGRVTVGHFALLVRLRREGRLEQVILFDSLDPEPADESWEARDRRMAERLLREWDPRLPLLAVVGGFHAQLAAAAGTTMAAHLARRLPGLQPAMLGYGSGRCRSRGIHALAGPMPEAPIVFRLPRATPAAVPGS